MTVYLYCILLAPPYLRAAHTAPTGDDMPCDGRALRAAVDRPWRKYKFDVEQRGDDIPVDS